MIKYAEKFLSAEPIPAQMFRLGKRISEFSSSGVFQAHPRSVLKGQRRGDNGKLRDTSGLPFNVCLCNAYRGDADCMDWHVDNDEWLLHSVVGSISLGRERPLLVRDSGHMYEIPLRAGSLCLFDGCEHCLPAVGASTLSAVTARGAGHAHTREKANKSHAIATLHKAIDAYSAAYRRAKSSAAAVADPSSSVEESKAADGGTAAEMEYYEPSVRYSLTFRCVDGAESLGKCYYHTRGNSKATADALFTE